MTERDGEHELHLHAARQGLDPFGGVRTAGKAEPFEQPHVRPVVPAGVERRDDALHVAELPVLVQVAGVEHDAELFLGLLLAGDVVHAEHRDATGVAADHVENELDERGFAGAVGTDEAHDVAGGQVEGDVVQREAGIVAFGDSGDGQRRRGRFLVGGGRRNGQGRGVHGRAPLCMVIRDVARTARDGRRARRARMTDAHDGRRASHMTEPHAWPGGFADWAARPGGLIARGHRPD